MFIRRHGAVCLCALICAAALIGALCARTAAPAVMTDAQRREAGGSEYTLYCVMHPEDGTLAVRQEIVYENTTGDVLNSLVLRAWVNAFAQEETSPAATDELWDACYQDAFSAGGIRLDGVWWQERPVSGYAFDDAAQTVLRVPVDALRPGEKGTLRVYYVIELPLCNYRFGRTEAGWQLGNAFLILPRYENGAWRTDEYYPVGDPFVSDCAVWHVSLTLPEGVTPVGSCRFEKDGNGQWHGTAEAARDFALTLSDTQTVASRTFGGVTVTAAAPDEKSGQRTLALCGKVLTTLTELYGPYPYATLGVSGVCFPFGGMEYPAYVMIGQNYMTDGADEDTLELLLAHEIAHQWFYALVGSDGYNQPWQDEGLCQWATLSYVRARYGSGAEESLRFYYVDAPMAEQVPGSVTPGSPIDYFGSLDAYSSVVYGRGAALCCALDTFLNGGLNGFLKAYCDQYAFSYCSRQAFEDALSAYAGQDVSPLIADYLDTLMD